MKIAISILMLALLTACGDGANPFEKPEIGVQPVDCAASGACN